MIINVRSGNSFIFFRTRQENYRECVKDIAEDSRCLILRSLPGMTLENHENIYQIEPWVRILVTLRDEDTRSRHESSWVRGRRTAQRWIEGCGDGWVLITSAIRMLLITAETKRQYEGSFPYLRHGEQTGIEKRPFRPYSSPLRSLWTAQPAACHLFLFDPRWRCYKGWSIIVSCSNEGGTEFDLRRLATNRSHLLNFAWWTVDHVHIETFTTEWFA